jgi:hypothetical protein
MCGPGAKPYAPTPYVISASYFLQQKLSQRTASQSSPTFTPVASIAKLDIQTLHQKHSAAHRRAADLWWTDVEEHTCAQQTDRSPLQHLHLKATLKLPEEGEEAAWSFTAASLLRRTEEASTQPVWRATPWNAAPVLLGRLTKLELWASDRDLRGALRRDATRIP